MYVFPGKCNSKPVLYFKQHLLRADEENSKTKLQSEKSEVRISCKVHDVTQRNKKKSNYGFHR